MSVMLRNSIFIHVPKTGGRWIKKMLIEHCEDSHHIGDPIYDSHKTPEADGKIAFAFIREPAYFCHSLWHHRSKKKSNKFGNKFNWQDYIRLERECKDENYEKFMIKCSENKNAVVEYYEHYIKKYYETGLKIGKIENLCDDLIRILNECNENFDEISIRKISKNIVGRGSLNNSLDLDIRKKINNANLEFCIKYGYEN